MSENICPTCGQVVTSRHPVLVSLETNTLAYRGRAVRMSPTMAEIAWVLAQRMPNPVARTHIIERVWGLGEPADALNNVYQHVYDLRRRITPLGLGIKSVRSIGYRMIESNG